MAKYYVTTPIYYPNDIPHIGHAYTTVIADVLARWHKKLGDDVFFLTGLDEHGKKIQEAAEAKGMKPREFVDKLVPEFKNAWKLLNLNYDHFVRTTDKDHELVVKEVLKLCNKKGDIYKGFYEGLYCTGCEAYYTEKELEEGNCPIHKKPVKTLKEESYFFRLSKYQNKLLEFYDKNKEFISPGYRKPEIINRVKEGLNDISISRTSFKWGVDLPFDKNHVTYVWFDALTNYISGIGYPKAKFKKYWPADLHLVGKDIFFFHAVLWPAMLMSAGIKNPKKVFAHGWWTIDGQKMSKSLGNVVNIPELVKYGTDSARYFLVREVPFGADGDFSMKLLVQRHNKELLNDLGNFVNRSMALLNKYSNGKIPKKGKDELCKLFNFNATKKFIDILETHNALSEIFKFVNECNKYVNEKQPWNEEDEKRLSNILYNLAEALRYLSIILEPFIPETAGKIAKQMNLKDKLSFKELKFGKLKEGHKIGKTEILFMKIEEEEKMAKKEEIANVEMVKGKDWIEFGDWEKMKLRTGTIKKVQQHPNADNLYVIIVDLGYEERQLVAGLKKFYAIDELMNKKVIVFTNLKPAVIRGIESEGMILAAEDAKSCTVGLLTVDKKELKDGAMIR